MSDYVLTDADRDLIAKTIGWQRQRFDEELGAAYATCDDAKVAAWHPDQSRDDFQLIMDWLGREENRTVRNRYQDALWDELYEQPTSMADRDCDWAIHSATPAQCCRAFLEAIR